MPLDGEVNLISLGRVLENVNEGLCLGVASSAAALKLYKSAFRNPRLESSKSTKQDDFTHMETLYSQCCVESIADDY